MKMLKIMLPFIMAVGLSAQAPIKPTKSKLDAVKGTVTMQAASVIDKGGRWNTKLYLSSPNTDTFKICFRYFDGTTTRSIIKTAISDAPNQPTVIVIELPIEIVETGSLYVYELIPVSVIELGQ